MADSDLIEKFREEWPNWSGGSLPKPIQAMATQQAEDHYIGSAIVVEFHPTKDLVWLRVRAVENLEKLSTREAQLLPLLAAGKSYKEIGSQLHIAHSTVNKHVLSIYKKLGVSSKAELGSIYLSFQK